MNEEIFYKYATSLSSWRAWIEIDMSSQRIAGRTVALLMESVD